VDFDSFYSSDLVVVEGEMLLQPYEYEFYD